MKNEDYDKLGERLKSYRIGMNLTQAQVALDLDVTPGYICNVEKNRTAMSMRMLTYYAKLLGISLDSLIGRIDSEYKNTALDNELLELIKEMDQDTKEKLLDTLKIWNKKEN